MKICEIFHSIQGEGVNAGVPAVFVRFFGCNLQCSWCDTKKSWHKDFAKFKELEINEIIEEINSYSCTHIVFTGGEPSLFQEEIRQIVNELNPPDSPFNKGEPQMTFEIETNGSFSLADDIYQTINISPKLKNSGNKPYEIQVLNFPKKTWWKFVVQDENDISEILEIQQKYKISNNKILLMPQGQTKTEIEKTSPLVITLCKKYNFRFSPRLQMSLGVR